MSATNHSGVSLLAKLAGSAGWPWLARLATSVFAVECSRPPVPDEPSGREHERVFEVLSQQGYDLS